MRKKFEVPYNTLKKHRLRDFNHKGFPYMVVV